MQTWVEWKPQNIELTNSLYFDQIYDTKDSLSFVIGEWTQKNNTVDTQISKKWSVTYKHPVHAYQSTYESFTIKALYLCIDKYGEKFLDWSVFIVKNSPYFEYVSSLSDIPLDPQKYTHYAFYCVNELFEVIADHEPTFELID